MFSLLILILGYSSIDFILLLMVELGVQVLQNLVKNPSPIGRQSCIVVEHFLWQSSLKELIVCRCLVHFVVNVWECQHASAKRKTYMDMEQARLLETGSDRPSSTYPPNRHAYCVSADCSGEH
jgi:hypothetical protein